jgi:hypothetical protein
MEIFVPNTSIHLCRKKSRNWVSRKKWWKSLKIWYAYVHGPTYIFLYLHYGQVSPNNCRQNFVWPLTKVLVFKGPKTPQFKIPHIQKTIVLILISLGHISCITIHSQNLLFHFHIEAMYVCCSRRKCFFLNLVWEFPPKWRCLKLKLVVGKIISFALFVKNCKR